MIVTRNNHTGSTNRKKAKSPMSPSYSCFRTCIKSPWRLIEIYKSSPGVQTLTKWLFSVSMSVFLLCIIPLSFYNYDQNSAKEEYYNLLRTIHRIFIGWTTLLAISPWIVTICSFIAGLSLARQCIMRNVESVVAKAAAAASTSDNRDNGNILPLIIKKSFDILKRPDLRKTIYVIGLSLITMSIVSVQTNLHMLYPSWFWNPFLLGYNVYWPSSIADATAGICVDKELNETKDGVISIQKHFRRGNHMPLCLSETSWRSLSTDVISPKREDDVKAVLDGIRFLKKDTSGIAFGIMSRDTINAIKPLRQNVEGLLPYTSNLAVVVFENDSDDGTREAFYKWSEEVKGHYIVEIIECEDSPGCKFNQMHRDFEKDIPYEKTSAIGRMGEFRQRLVDHVVDDSKYTNYSHYLVLDIDLSVSISPLGILHSIGKLPNEAVASSGRQARPGSLGSLAPPYDFSAFVAYESPTNKRLIKLNERFCALKPEGYRWRNECRAVSVAQFMMIQGGDKLNNGEPYLVNSAFNGAVLYPIQLLRESKAKYDGGNDGQRCEHIGFNLSLNRPMFINPKWDMHLHPHLMGGPSGKRAMRTVNGILKSPTIAPILVGQNMVSMMIFIYCIITLTVLILFPLWLCVSRSVPTVKEMELLLNPHLKKKIKGSEHEFEKNSLLLSHQED